MKRHDLDLFSLVSGALFLALAVVFGLRAVNVISLDLGAVPAIVFIVFGVAILASVATSVRAGRSAGADSESTPEPMPEPMPASVSVSVSETDTETAGP